MKDEECRHRRDRRQATALMALSVYARAVQRFTLSYTAVTVGTYQSSGSGCDSAMATDR